MAYRLLLIGLLLAAVGYTVASRFIPMDAWTAAETINAQTLPTFYGVLLSMVLVVLLTGPRPQPAESVPLDRRALRVVGICALILIFVVTVAWINLWIALGFLLFSTSWWLGERRWTPLLMVALLVPLAGYTGIELLLGVYLPS
jgi:hypothetical protein